MKISTSLRAIVSICSMVLLTIFATAFSINAQVIRPYGSPLYSDNLHGGHTIFGNTITAIYTSGSGSTGVVNTTAMNDFQTTNTGNYTNSRTSAYSNNSANIQHVDVDGVGGTTSLLAYGGLWRYYSLNNYSAAPPDVSSLNWTADAYDDASNWTNTANNTNAFGFSESGVNSPTQTNRSTYYLRRDINITNPSQYSAITLTVRYDDGAIVYVNGVEVARMNMPAGSAPYATNPGSSREWNDADFVVNIPSASFLNGNNQIAVAVYNRSTGTNDLYYDMKLDGINPATSTFNSSSADLVMPAGTNIIKFARLYWGGRINGGTGGAGNINLRTVKIRKGTSGAYTDVTAPVSQIDKSLISGSDSAYQSYVDVTGFINVAGNGAGTYTVANVTSATGSENAGNYAAWSIVVVYENAAVPYNSVRVYDGYLQVFNGGPLTISLTGLSVPSATLVPSDAYMTALSWEGDANLAVTAGNPQGDYIKVNGTIASAGVNLAANFWNGTISKNGNFITTKNPDFKNQMSIDIDEMEVGTGYGIVPGATQVNIEFGSEADQYFPSLFAFTIRAKDPEIILNKSVSDNLVPFGTVQVNETLTYTLSGANIGLANAYNCVVVDTVPSNVTYIPGSLEVVNSPGIPSGIKTDAQDGDHAFKASNAGNDYVKFFIGTGATSTTGGILAAGETYTLRFKVITPSLPGQLSTVNNTARITGQNIFGDPFADDGTAIIALGAVTPVKMTSFTVKKENNNAVLRWTTSSETKNDHFAIERSVDGLNFVKMGELPGSGTTTLTKTYMYPDALTNVTSKILYYRLRIVDIDGKSTFSQIVALRLDGSVIMNDLSVYPNPFINHVKLQLQSLKEETGNIRIINTNGQEVVKRTVTLQPGGNIVIVKDLDAVSPGLYMLELRIGEDVFVQKIMKQ
jgi:uncharacterized repeat protein (TIGR01451 family)